MSQRLVKTRSYDIYAAREGLDAKFRPDVVAPADSRRVIGDPEWRQTLVRLQSPIVVAASATAAAARDDEAPCDSVNVYGRTVHRVLCRGVGANGAWDEVVGLVSAELAEHLGAQRLDDMRITKPASASALTAAEAAEPLIDPRFFGALRRCGLVSAGATAETPRDLGLAFLALRRYEIITLWRQPANKHK